MDGLKPPVVLNYATPIGHGDAPPAGSRLRLERSEGGVCIIDPPRGRVAAIPGMIGIGGIEFMLLLLLAAVVNGWMRHGTPVGSLIFGVGVLVILIAGLICVARIIWRSVQMPKTVEVRGGFLRRTNHHDLFGRDRWEVEKIRRIYITHLGLGFGIARPFRTYYDVAISFRGFRAQRRVFRYLSRAEALWAANVLNRAMGLREIRVRRRRWFSVD